MKPRLTHAQLIHWLDYDPADGIFKARIARRNIKGVGVPVGWKDDRGYIRLFLNRELFLAHRLAWFWAHKKWPKEEIDHRNGVRNDNRIKNLREATPHQNGMSVGMQKNNSSGYKGVTKAKSRGVWHGRWQAQIGAHNQHFHLGFFKDPARAAKAYDKAARQQFGKFAKTNASLGLL